MYEYDVILWRNIIVHIKNERIHNLGWEKWDKIYPKHSDKFQLFKNWKNKIECFLFLEMFYFYLDKVSNFNF